MFAGLINQAKAAVAAFERRGGRDEEVVSAGRPHGSEEMPSTLRH